MTQQTTAGAVPQLTLGWRLKMALGDRVGVQEMAEHLGVARATLSRWMGDKGKAPNRAYIAQWALITGVPFQWLLDGTQNSPSPDGSGTRADTEAELPHLDSNQEPSG